MTDELGDAANTIRSVTTSEIPASQNPLYAPPFSSQGLIVAGGCDLLFTTGLVAITPQGEIVEPDDAAAQARRIFSMLSALLAEAGGSLADVVKLTVFLMDRRDTPAVRRVRNELWPTRPPVSSTVEVGLGLEGIRVEIEAVAALSATRRR